MESEEGALLPENVGTVTKDTRKRYHRVQGSSIKLFFYPVVELRCWDLKSLSVQF